jgi:hypothetical protein
VLWLAFALSLLLHVGAVVATHLVRVDLTQAVPVPRERAVEIALEPEQPADAAVTGDEPDPARPETERERIFTSIPERLASDTPPVDDPNQPQYLAMYHSLAANPTLGGDALQPSAPRPGESPQVALRREQLEGAAGVQVPDAADGAVPGRARENAPAEPVEPAAQEAAQRQLERARQEQARKRGQAFATDDQGEVPLPRPEDGTEGRTAAVPGAVAPPLEKWWQGSAPSVLRPGAQGVPGDRGFEFDQDATGPQTSGVARVGDYSLNTWEWNYAPWMQAFGNALMRNWVPPPARRMGLISGRTVLRVIVEKSGVVSAAEVIETEGHQSLHDASRAALLSSSPFAPLPSHFPLAHLEIRLTMFYPEPTR